jgi:hypothetical protein
MKTPHLLASFAVAATVSATDLKDPAAVARDWNETTSQSTDPLTGDLSLKAQTAPAPRLPAPPVALFEPRSRGRTNSLAPRDGNRLPESLYDAPNYRVPEKLPNDRPRGAVPWEYNGEVYWLVPLGTPVKE